jgi:formylmethanofuran dehydrogenase subunit E
MKCSECGDIVETSAKDVNGNPLCEVCYNDRNYIEEGEGEED